MNYTVNDFYQTFHSKIKHLSGQEGIFREITDVGILDYEIDSHLRERYFHTNFAKNLLVITSFSVIKDNPFRISEIVKHLIDKECSGLVIKNVFRISIPESVFRYADYKKFPIFLIDDDKLFFKNIIYEVFRKIEMMRDVVFIQQELDLLLKQKLSADEIKEHAKRIFPSCGEQFFVIYAEQNSNSAFFSFEEIEHRFKKSPLKNSTNTVLPYREGFFFICSDEKISSKLSGSQVQSILESLIQVSE